MVATLGDSHGGMWVPGLLPVARAQHLAIVALYKPGCFVNRVHTNLPGWPCASWYRWALAQHRRLHPAATPVSFKLTGGYLEQHARSTVSELRSVDPGHGRLQAPRRGHPGMLRRTHHRWIPTLQWFCAEGICPSVIDHTLTTHADDHLTMEWSAALAPLLGPEIRRVVRRWARVRAARWPPAFVSRCTPNASRVRLQPALVAVVG